MDPATAALIASSLKTALDSAAGEAGRSAWNRFSEALGRVFGKDSRIAESASEVTRRIQNDGDLGESINLFTNQLRGHTESERVLRMLQSHFPNLQQLQISQVSGNTLGNVNNSISGNARVGSVIQAGHVSNGIRIERLLEN